jgi:hypothetical protein
VSIVLYLKSEIFILKQNPTMAKCEWKYRLVVHRLPLVIGMTETLRLILVIE